MKIPKIRVRKGILYTLGTIAIVFIVLVAALSPFAKYYLEKHDVNLFGRETSIGWAYVNPFTGYLSLHNVKIYELDSDTVFISAQTAAANFSLSKLLSKQVVIEALSIDHPWARIVQRKDTLNFDDLIARFSGGDTDTTNTSHSNDWHVTLLDTDIKGGEFHYYEKIIPINYFIKNLTISGPGKTQDVDTLSAKFSFEDGRGKGKMQGDFTINQKTLDYRFGVEVKAFDMEIIRQYIWELINYGMFHTQLDARLQATGNFKSTDSLSAKGKLRLTNFHLGKTNEDAYIAFKKLSLSIDELSPARDKFLFDSITLESPYLKYEVFDSLDNVQALFGKKGKNISDITSQSGRFNLVIEIAQYLKEISRNFFVSDFQINSLSVINGDFVFNDFSTTEKFAIRANPLTIRADSVKKTTKNVSVTLKSEIQPYGKAAFFMSVNPKDSGDFDLKYSIEQIPASVFNPYLLSITSFPLDRGTLEANGMWRVRKGVMKGSNHVLVIDPRVTKRVKNKDEKWLPMPLIMALVRDQGNVIDFEIPITGNLKHPEFQLTDIITDVIKNIFVKPVTTPYRMEVKSLEREIEKSLSVVWAMNQRSLTKHQRKFVKNVAEFLKDHKEASIQVHPIEYELKEKEHILFYETKKKYFLVTNHKPLKDFSEDDSMKVNLMSVKDRRLVKYISRNLSDTVMFTLQEKCINFVGSAAVNRSFNNLVKARRASFLEVFAENGTMNQVKWKPAQTIIPYNGFSLFKFDYPGGVEDDLKEAYEKMRQLDNEPPRKKYLKDRQKAAGL